MDADELAMRFILECLRTHPNDMEYTRAGNGVKAHCQKHGMNWTFTLLYVEDDT